MNDQERYVAQALIDRILSITSDSPTLVGISGRDGSGKTHLADKLADIMKGCTTREVIRISIDDFMNERAIRRRNPDSVVGCYEDTFNLALFESAALRPLRDRSGPYASKVFDYASDTEQLLVSAAAAPVDAIVLIDGVFMYQQRLNAHWDLRIQLEADESVLIERGARRDVSRVGTYEQAVAVYKERYIPSQRLYYERESPLDVADVIVDVNNLQHPLILRS